MSDLVPVIPFATGGLEPVCASMVRCMWRSPSTHLLGSFQSFLDACYCLDAPDSMPAGSMMALALIDGIGPSGPPPRPVQRLVSR